MKMKLNLIFQFLILAQLLSAQTFTEMMGTPFEDVAVGSVAFSDVNGDGHPDVFLTGVNSSDVPLSKLYTNDGLGNFTEMTNTPFEGVFRSTINFSDVDGDGDQDLLVTGAKDPSVEDFIAKLYINDGIGNFTEMTNTPFEGVWSGSVAFSDINGDGYQDVLITGHMEQFGGEPTLKLCTNDGLGNFTEITDTPLDAVWGGSVDFLDVNGDGHEDVLIMGAIDASGFEKISKLYTNDGTGNFTEMTGTPFQGVFRSSAAFSDVNGDGHEDVLITGNGNGRIAKLYTNDGVGNFTEMTGTPFQGVWVGSVAFSDVNGDGHEDVLIAGMKDMLVAELIAKLYINDGLGNFTEMTDTPFEGVWNSSAAFSDVNGDGYEDVLITGGKNAMGDRTSKLYTNGGGVSSTKELSVRLNLDFISYPNPTKPNSLNINYKSAENGYVILNVYNSNGQLLNQQKEVVAIGQQTFLIDIASLAKGSYFIQLDNGKRKGVSEFIVQ